MLAEHGITSLALLRKQDPLRIEAVGGVEKDSLILILSLSYSIVVRLLAWKYWRRY